MKNKKLALFTLIIGILLIVVGFSISVYIYLNQKNENNKQIEDTILKAYEVFKTNTESFDDIRSTYYNDVAKALYPESVETEYEKWYEILNQYTESVDKVEKSSSELKQHCINRYYSNSDVKNKCDSFVIAYETVINYYTKDIIAFNEIIDTYLENAEESKDKIKTYELKYDYTDINLDGKFIGKN